MANNNTKRRRALGHGGYGVKRGAPINSSAERAARGKKPWVGASPPKRAPKKSFRKEVKSNG